MADFDVTIRRGYPDIAGLVLDCRPGDLVEEGGKALRWRNSAPRRRGRVRFGDPQQPTAANAPLAVAGRVGFQRANSHYLQVPLRGAFTPSKTWTFAYTLLALGLDDGQAVLASADNSLVVYCRSSGVVAYEHSGGVVTGSLPLTAGTGVFTLNTTADYFVQNQAAIGGGAFATDVSFPGDNDAAMYVGRDPGGNYLDAALSRVLAWDRALSPREVELLYKSLEPGTENERRAAVTLAPWTGERLNPLVGRQPRYHRVELPAVDGRVQLACEVSGEVLPDSELGGDLFSLQRVEAAGPVVVEQDAGWSSVFDVVVREQGHYSVLVSRAGDKGGRIVRFDVA